jgi:hypothetical protein
MTVNAFDLVHQIPFYAVRNSGDSSKSRILFLSGVPVEDHTKQNPSTLISLVTDSRKTVVGMNVGVTGSIFTVTIIIAFFLRRRLAPPMAFRERKVFS